MSTADDVKAKALVRNVLSAPVTRKVTFQAGQWSIGPDFYAQVARAIADNKIYINADLSSKGAGVAALYNPVLDLPGGKKFYDVLTLRITSLGKTPHDQLSNAGHIIHECTHAGLDMLKIKKMSRLDHETLGYIAEARMQWVMLQQGGQTTPKASFPGDAIRTASWRAAADIDKTGSVSKYAVARIYAALLTNATYGLSTLSWANNDGVGRPWKY